ncbi:MAG: DNA-directed RNA polymerase subunit alpha [Planctomycetaceae bacterium]|uniref:DNA-directed RNA polymerase subunit alpha n=1 Tax=Lacipirellula limnantheis TaxID=2528024 RepID=A0A517U2X9_9BACT|nr:DNA-directed RNA polymerase subunit alpha C-terminal domain-containing protein [Lacipirellula limnantheis]MBL9163464.1 DNA-directed RNA polymerase subunit alpha [Planctomycetaceae bacterium]QDT74978.1 DNA-directed RNA polymerase subunit alpha [Lacipirellula limnantheis]
MSPVAEFDLRQTVISNSTFGPNEIKQIAHAISSDYNNFRTLRDATNELAQQTARTPAASARLGVCQYLIGRYGDAVQTLTNADGGALTHFYLGKSYLALDRYAEALKGYESAERAGYNKDEVTLAKADAMRYSGDAAGALKVLDGLSGAVEQTAEYLYQRAATVAALGGNRSEVIALLERAIDADSTHPGVLFSLALENDRHGNDDYARQLYERAAKQFPTNVGTLINLGLLYEDIEHFERAKQCYLRILDVFPGHERARLYFKDADASRDMYYDEEARRRQDRLSQILSVPVTDFELSVRSRNCLQKMGIMTLGDLTETTEQELLSSKNFGETSLVEIREMLSSKGLELGQFASTKWQEEPVFESNAMSEDERALLDRPIADLNLSVRARKCMVRLGLTTIGELLRRTGDDLLECKNFGVTSLNEVREKLTANGLKLRGD